MHLYEMTNEYVQVFEELSNLEHLDSETVENTLSAIKHDIKNKSINVAAYIKNVEGEIKLIDEYIKRMQEKKKARLNTIEKIREYLRLNMEKCNFNKISSPEFTIALGAEDIKTEIIDEGQIPIDYCRKTEKWEPDKIKIKEAIINGAVIDGVRLIRKRRLTIK